MPIGRSQGGKLKFFNGYASHVRARGLRVVAGLAVTGAVGAGLAGVWGTGPASANTTGHISVRYQCPFPLIGDYQVTAVISWVQPDSIMVGEPSPTIPVSVTISVQSADVQAGHAMGAQTLEAAMVVSSVVIAPQGDIDVNVPLTMPRTSAPGSGTAYAVASGSFPPLVFTRAVALMGGAVTGIFDGLLEGSVQGIGSGAVGGLLPHMAAADGKIALADAWIPRRRPPARSAAPVRRGLPVLPRPAAGPHSPGQRRTACRQAGSGGTRHSTRWSHGGIHAPVKSPLTWMSGA
jgi:hypothetical protein